MESDEYEDPSDELLDSLPLHLRNKVLKQAYGEDDERIIPERAPDEVPQRVPFTTGESVLWWLLLPVAAVASLTLVVLAILTTALLLLPIALMLWALAAVPVGSMAVWRMGGSRRVTT